MNYPHDTIFRVEAIRYGTDGYPVQLRWRVMPLDPAAADAVGEVVDIATIDEAVIAAYAGRLYCWGTSRVVNKIQIVARPFGGLMLIDSGDAIADARLTSLPMF